jgi:hypothetical protein
MTPKSNCGQTALAPETILPELAIDMSEGQRLPSSLGKTEVPVHVLPEMAVDFGLTVAALQLRLTLRPEATPGQVALDLFQLYAAVNQVELSLGGAGLLPRDATDEAATANGTLSVTFQPANLDGAAERLAAVATAINGAKDYPSLQRCDAKLISVAA